MLFRSNFKKIYLLAVSYYFYACIDLRAVPFIIAVTLVIFFAAKYIEGKEDDKAGKKSNASCPCGKYRHTTDCSVRHMFFM